MFRAPLDRFGQLDRLPLAFRMAVAGTAILASAACVPAGRYEALRRTSTERQAADSEKIQMLGAELERAHAITQARDVKLAELDTSRHNAQAALDEATAMNAQLRSELANLGRDVDALLGAKGSLATSLADAKRRLEELRRAQAAAEARATLFREVTAQLRPSLTAGDVVVEPRRGRLSLLVKESVLFRPKRAELVGSGEKLLGELARALIASVPRGSQRRFIINAHADEPPVGAGPGPSASYELGAKRAIVVVDKLVRMGMKPEQLMIASSGAFDRVTRSPEADAKLGANVLEICLQPTAEDAVSVPEIK